eukprot:9476060-Pyramimonas_sp.AAC.1
MSHAVASCRPPPAAVVVHLAPGGKRSSQVARNTSDARRDAWAGRRQRSSAVEVANSWYRLATPGRTLDNACLLLAARSYPCLELDTDTWHP